MNKLVGMILLTALSLLAAKPASVGEEVLCADSLNGGLFTHAELPALPNHADRLQLLYGDEKDGNEILQLMNNVFREPGMNLGALADWYDAHQDVNIEELGSANRRVIYVLREKATGRLVGVAALIEKFDSARFNETDVGEISKLYLAPEYRKLGLGKWLASELVQRASDQRLHFRKLFLQTRVEFKDAIEVYRRLGFVTADPPRSRYPEALESFELVRPLP